MVKSVRLNKWEGMHQLATGLFDMLVEDQVPECYQYGTLDNVLDNVFTKLTEFNDPTGVLIIGGDAYFATVPSGSRRDACGHAITKHGRPKWSSCYGAHTNTAPVLFCASSSHLSDGPNWKQTCTASANAETLLSINHSLKHTRSFTALTLVVEPH